MTENKDQNLDLEATLAETTSKVESFYTNNKKQINYALIAVVAIIGGYLAFTQMYLKPLEAEAQREIFRAQMYFERDSFELAYNGNESFQGFSAIVDGYGLTKAGNLAKYYAGICCLRTGKFDEAIDYLKSFDTENELIAVLAKGALGDAYSEAGAYDKAADYYTKAARMSKNKVTAPMFLKKAGLVYEELGKFSKAADSYETIKNDFADSQEANDIDKYIARARTMSNN
jgi:tetratricopeptide (TPR) repeat protein